MTDIKFTEGIVLIETITGKAFSEPQLNAYRTLLNDIPDELFVQGKRLNKCNAERKSIFKSSYASRNKKILFRYKRR